MSEPIRARGTLETMRLTYDPVADALYIELKATTPVDSHDVEDAITVDLDDAGHVIGIELLDVQKRLGAEALSHISIDRLPAEPLAETTSS